MALDDNYHITHLRIHLFSNVEDVLHPSQENDECRVTKKTQNRIEYNTSNNLIHPNQNNKSKYINSVSVYIHVLLQAISDILNKQIIRG